MGNPFLDNSKDLYSLETKEIVDPKRIQFLYSAEDVGQRSFQSTTTQDSLDV